MATFKSWLNSTMHWFLLFIPLTWLLIYIDASPALLFFMLTLSLIPIAHYIGHASKDVALQSNPTIGGLVNATCGNLIELIIAIFALREGLTRIVEASIIGSIIGNLLLLLGLSIFAGGLRFTEQNFNKTSIGISSTMLIIAVIGLAIPTAYANLYPANTANITLLSDAVAMVLAITYLASLFFSLKTHKHLFDVSDEMKAAREKPEYPLKVAVLIIAVATLFAALQSELLVKSIEPGAQALGLSQTFIGVVIIAIITNIAEKFAAISFALRNKLDISLEIGLSSAIQIALFVVPILIFLSEIFNWGFLIVFPLFEILAVFATVMIVNYLSSDGKCNWLEGVQLLSVYLILAIAFFFI
ncbi:MAG TPA: calcium/proton exchanger [Acidobacteriota bacterium]|nr:calcium/proton exchanger [Acidobacteriota bacterium]